MKVLVTRPESDAEQHIAALKTAGFDALSAPVIEIKFHEALTSFAEFSAVAFTSSNGVRAFAKATIDRDFQVFTVGPSTSKLAKEVGFQNVQEADSSVESLAELIIENTIESTPIVHIAGSHRAGDLRATLKASQRLCVRKVLYEACEVRQFSPSVVSALRAGKIDAVTFFSPRSASIFIKLLKAHDLEEDVQGVLCVCLSAQIAEEVKQFGWENIHSAREPNQNALIDILRMHRT